MEIKFLDDENFESVLEKHFEKNETVICAIVIKNCESCNETKENIENFLDKYPSTKLHFYLIKYGDTDLYSKYYQIPAMFDYPRIAIFHGSKDMVSFLEGFISFEHFEDIHNKFGI